MDQSAHVLVNKFENLPGYGNFFSIMLNISYKYLPDCCTKSPWLQDANVGSSGVLVEIMKHKIAQKTREMIEQLLKARGRAENSP